MICRTVLSAIMSRLAGVWGSERRCYSQYARRTRIPLPGLIETGCPCCLRSNQRYLNHFGPLSTSRPISVKRTSSFASWTTSDSRLPFFFLKLTTALDPLMSSPPKSLRYIPGSRILPRQNGKIVLCYLPRRLNIPRPAFAQVTTPEAIQPSSQIKINNNRRIQI